MKTTKYLRSYLDRGHPLMETYNNIWLTSQADSTTPNIYVYNGQTGDRMTTCMGCGPAGWNGDYVSHILCDNILEYTYCPILIGGE